MDYIPSTKYLFGGPRHWDLHAWTASDDRVRGGSSVSHLSPTERGVRFHGNLDITTLGGAGFASQRTTTLDSASGSWDLSHFAGLELDIARADSKRYTFALTDDIPARRPDGREQSALIWEFDFCAEKPGPVRVAWDQLRPTYRGKEVHDARPLDRTQIRRCRLMVRSFFGEQDGDFALEVRSIAAVGTVRYRDNPDLSEDSDEELDEQLGEKMAWYSPRQGTWRSILGCCGLC